MSDANQIDVLRARAIASMPSKQKLQPRPLRKQSEVEREEGELCSSDDDQVSLSSQPTSGRGIPSNNSRLGRYSELLPQEKMRMVGTTGASNVVMPEATSSAANANAIVRKSEFLSGLTASAPFTISMKSLNDVEITKFSVASQTHTQTPLAGVNTTSQHGSAVQSSEREPTISQGLVDGPAKDLPAAAPVYRPAPDSFRARHPIKLGKNTGRAGDVTKVSKGTPGRSLIAPHRPFSPPFAASHRPISPLVGARPSSGARSQTLPHSADRSEADKFLAGLTLPGKVGTNSEFIINFDDSDSDGERVQIQPAKVQLRNGVNRIGAAGDKSISRSLIPPNGNSEPNRLRVGRTTGMSYNKATANTRSGTMIRTVSVSKPPPSRPDAQIETLRQLIAAKESQIEQNKRVSQVPEPQSHATAGSLRQDGTQNVGRTAGSLLGVNSESKILLKKKPGISSFAHVDSRLSSIQVNRAELSGRGIEKVEKLVSGKPSEHQVSTEPSGGTAAIQQVDGAGGGAKESRVSSFRSFEEVGITAPSRGDIMIPAVTAAEPSHTVIARGTAAAVSTEPALSGVKPADSGRRSIPGVSVIESGMIKPGNRESLQVAPRATGCEKTELADLIPASPLRADGRGPSSLSAVSGERPLEPIQPEQVRGLGLKRRGFGLEHSPDRQKKHQLDHSSNMIQTSGRPGSDSAYRGNSDSEVANLVTGVSADEDKVIVKRQRTGEHSPQVLSVAEHIAANVPPVLSLPERSSKEEFCSPCPSPADQGEKCRGESRIFNRKNVPFSPSAFRVGDQQHSHALKRKALDGHCSSKVSDRPSTNTLGDSKRLHVQRPTSTHFSNSQVEHSQLIRNGENMAELANATVSRVLEAQGTDNHHVARVDGGDAPCSSLQPSRDLSNTIFVATTDAAGIQIMNNDGIKPLPCAINSIHIVQSEVPDKLSLRENHESAPDPGDPGGFSPWSTLPHFESGGSHLEQLRMQHTVGGGSSGYSLENLREEEEVVEKDLEEAQVYRRDCEIRERELRRAYRESQLALSKANGRCEALSQRQKYLSVQVQTAELRSLQQPSFSILDNSTSLVPFVPFNNITYHRITELPISGYPSTVGVTAKPLTEYELGLRRVSNEQEAHIQSSAQVNDHTLNVPSSSADTEILEENLDRKAHHGTQSPSGQIPSTEEATFDGVDALYDKDRARNYGFCVDEEVSMSTNSESPTSLQRQRSEKHTGNIVSSDAAGHGELRLSNLVDSQDSFHEDQDLQNRYMAIHNNDISVPGNEGGMHTPFTSASIAQVQAQVAETEEGKEARDARVMLSSTVKTDRGLLKLEETRTAFGSDQYVQICLQTPGQGPFEDTGEVIKATNITMQEPITTDDDVSNVFNVLGQDLPSPHALGSGTGQAFASTSEQDMDMVDLEGLKPLEADSRSQYFPNSELMISEHGSQNEGSRKQHSGITAAAGLTKSLKNKREISGLRALAENDEYQHLGRGCEDTSGYSGPAIRPSSLEDTPIEEWTDGLKRTVNEQSRSIAQGDDSEANGDKGDCASRTSILSDGETRSLEKEDGREESKGNDIDDVCPELPSPARSAENRFDDIPNEGELLDRSDLFHESKNLVLDDPSVDIESMQLPSTALSIGFANLGTGDVPALCLAYHQVVSDKRFDEFTFRLASYESPLTMFRSYRMCSAFQTAWHNSVTSQTWSHMLDSCKPLCMFEHRGKCNDDACPWQHIAEYTLDDVHLLSQLSKYLNPEQEVEAQKLSSEAISASLGKIINGASKNVGSIISNKLPLPRLITWNRGSPVPLYKIGPYSINQDESLTSGVRCCLSNQYKFNLFTSFTLSSAVRRPVVSDMPCLPTVFFNIDSQTTTSESSGWRYTGERSLAAMEEHVHNEPGDIEAWLELALIRIDFDLNCTDNDAYHEALYVLSRALEANPSVSMLWIVYIGLYYHGKSDIGDDDLFLPAIENCKGSYELLLLYINSRTTLPERLKAYEMALEALVNVGEHSQEQSACILDVVIQMLDCMCVAKIPDLLHTWSEGVVSSSGTSASLLACLIPEDCCILIVACAYAIAFGQLPQNCLLLLGYKQQLPWDLDWSRHSQVQEGSKDLVLKIMEAGMRCGPVLSQEVSEQVMAINYLKCLTLYYGSKHALRISWQIMERHSTCLELALFVVHLEKEKGWKDVFQQALQNSSQGSIDQQKLWYQYAVHMLKAEGSVGAMNILHQCATATCLGVTEWENFSHTDQVDETRKALQLNTRKFEKDDGTCTVGREAVFAWMNLALYEILSGNEVDAHLALEKGMKAAVTREDIQHSWKEMASFIRTSKAGPEQASAILDLLDRCSVATSATCKLVPLATNLLSSISKRRVRVFLESLMGSTSIDHSLLNCVVEVIISKEPSVTKEVALIVESVMEMFPGNHELLSQICRMVIGNPKSIADMSAAVWISSLLFGSLLQASPQACEQHWVEAGQLLERLQDESSLRSFYQIALVHQPFSASLKRSAAIFDDSIKPDVF